MHHKSEICVFFCFSCILSTRSRCLHQFLPFFISLVGSFGSIYYFIFFLGRVSRNYGAKERSRCFQFFTFPSSAHTNQTNNTKLNYEIKRRTSPCPMFVLLGHDHRYRQSKERQGAARTIGRTHEVSVLGVVIFSKEVYTNQSLS